MTVCHASSIVFDGRSIAWFGPGNAIWQVPVGHLLAIGELIGPVPQGEGAIAFVVDTSGSWMQAPVQSDGMAAALAALSHHLGVRLEPQLTGRASRQSRIMWPAALLDHELLVFGEAEHSWQRTASLHPHLLAYLAQEQR